MYMGVGLEFSVKNLKELQRIERILKNSVKKCRSEDVQKGREICGKYFLP